MDPPCACQWTPPFERRNMAPLANGPPLWKEETWPGPLTRGGGAVVGIFSCLKCSVLVQKWLVLLADTTKYLCENAVGGGGDANTMTSFWAHF